MDIQIGNPIQWAGDRMGDMGRARDHQVQQAQCAVDATPLGRALSGDEAIISGKKAPPSCLQLGK